MIITRPMGGMGNQMYALALAKSLSLRLGQPLVIDKSWVRDDGKQRGLDRDSLQHFSHGIPEWSWSSNSLGRLFLGRMHDKLLGPILKLISRRNPWYQVETACRFDPEILDLPGPNVYLRGGTWQSWRYFKDYQDAIRTMFTFQESVQEQNSEWVARIGSVPVSVFVHIRRGDYVNNPAAAYTQGICTLEYYKRAMERMREHLDNPVFFFFSDDMDWVVDTFGQAPDHIFVQRRPGRDNESGFRDDGQHDMYCMSVCQHAIVANSTFSWWAAWLIRNPEKRIIAPDRWYQDIPDDAFIVPPQWERLHGQG